VGTRGGGLNRLRPGAVDLVDLGCGPPLDAVQSLGEDTAGTLWAATRSGALARQQGSGWAALSTNDGWSGVPAAWVAADPQGGVWVGTRKGGLRHWARGVESEVGQPAGWPGDFLRALLATPAGNVWVGTESPYGLHRLRKGEVASLGVARRERRGRCADPRRRRRGLGRHR